MRNVRSDCGMVKISVARLPLQDPGGSALSAALGDTLHRETKERVAQDGVGFPDWAAAVRDGDQRLFMHFEQGFIENRRGDVIRPGNFFTVLVPRIVLYQGVVLLRWWWITSK
ncbi:hypothetical protein MKZ38_007028 [Zalerion maritima]|uniref:Uncharacterized protein n=1 Tax=Zalerion maritima TaxID=339359 RepID=A0AAD5RV71_9PEZI|nr:hypothetical protein MKZ38_007028 [Zalerion maritima]